MRESRAILLGAAILSGIVAFPQVAVAEVMDKEPTLVATWAWALVGGALGSSAGAGDGGQEPCWFFCQLHTSRVFISSLRTHTLAPTSCGKPGADMSCGPTAPPRCSSCCKSPACGTSCEDGLMLPANPSLERPGAHAAEHGRCRRSAQAAQRPSR